MPITTDLANPAQLLRAHGAVPVQGGRPFTGLVAQFNGSDNYLDPATTANIPALDAAKTVAFRYWIDPALASPTQKILFSIVHDDTSGAGAAMDFETGAFWGISAIGWGSSPFGTVFTTDAGTGVAPQRWIDFVYTFDGGTTHCLYADDGEDRGAGTGFATLSKAPQTGSTGIVRIGSFNAAFPTPFFQGWMSDVVVASRAWSATDVYRWHDPATRFELYWVPSGRVFFDFPASTASVGSSSGLTTVLGIGRALATAVGITLGAVTVTGISSGSGAAAGVATVSAVGAAAVSAVGVCGGSATVLGAAAGASIGASAGVATVTGIGAAFSTAVGSASGSGADSGSGGGGGVSGGGTGTALGIGQAFASSMGVAVGSSTVSGVPPITTVASYLVNSAFFIVSGDA